MEVKIVYLTDTLNNTEKVLVRRLSQPDLPLMELIIYEKGENGEMIQRPMRRDELAGFVYTKNNPNVKK